MRPDLGELLRRVGDSLAGPDAAVTRRAREAAIASVPPGRRRSRVAVIGGAALALVAAAVAVVPLTVPGGVTAGEARGLVFLPADGWFVLQAGTPATPSRPGVAIASNVPLNHKDTADGFPYSTLQALPARGIVLVASFMWLGDSKSTTRLPLRLRDAVPYIRWGGQVRPRKPLGQYELRGVVEGYEVDLQAYFGSQRPSRAQLAEAQRQLDRLVVSPESESPGVGRAPMRADAVTIAFRRYWYPPGNYYQMRFFGTISSGAAGEYVAVVKKECGSSYATAIAGALTQPGGAWEAVPDRPAGGGEFRARWNDELSEPVVYRPPVTVWLEKVGSGRFTATVSTYVPAGGKAQNMSGRRIDLQRLSAGRWVLMRSGKLVRKKTVSDNLFLTWTAMFSVPTKGLRLRAYVPGRSARPCFAGGASKPVRS